MRIITGKRIQGDIYRLLRESPIYENISGEVYRNGTRPRDSCSEDAVVTFTAGLPGQIHTGVVTINIYVPDIDPFDNGILIENGQRTEELETIAQTWVDNLTPGTAGYKFDLQQTIYTMEDAEINQHFIVVKLKYNYCNE